MGKKCKVNDFLIDFTCIYKITKISHFDNNRLIHFYPIKGTDRVFTCRIPEKNLLKAGIRHILTDPEVKVILEKFKVAISKNHSFNPRQFKEDLYTNNVESLIDDLKSFYCRKTPLLRSEEELKRTILNYFCLEISFVTSKEVFSLKKTIESSILGK